MFEVFMYLFSHQNISLARVRRFALFVLLLECPFVLAQPNSEAAPEKGLVIRYQSMLDGYQPYKEQPVSSWRQANDVVEKIGGWRAYAREAGTSEAVQPGAIPANTGASNLPGGSHE
jgi:hypothetical protein